DAMLQRCPAGPCLKAPAREPTATKPSMGGNHYSPIANCNLHPLGGSIIERINTTSNTDVALILPLPFLARGMMRHVPVFRYLSAEA
ncbi:hypothetical protein MMC16_000202, partial [Acarospora aff. strigata]|nr:hypothetical protein [Acarospora aff. strigata]